MFFYFHHLSSNVNLAITTNFALLCFYYFYLWFFVLLLISLNMVNIQSTPETQALMGLDITLPWLSNSYRFLDFHSFCLLSSFCLAQRCTVLPMFCVYCLPPLFFLSHFSHSNSSYFSSSLFILPLTPSVTNNLLSIEHSRHSVPSLPKTIVLCGDDCF